MAAPHPMTPVSAASQLLSWLAVHGRLPTEDECVPANGLPHWKTIYLRFPGARFSARLSGILVEAGWWSASSSPVSVVAAGTCHGRLLRCLRCDVPFSLDPAVRICTACKRRGREPHEEPPALTAVELRRYGIGLADWDEEVWR